MANKHVIGKQVLEVAMGPKDNAYAIQQRLSELVWNDLCPQLNDLFDQIVGEDEVLRLEKIELDLGTVDLEEPEMLVHSIRSLLEKELRRHTSLITPKSLAPFRPWESNAGHQSRYYTFELWVHWLKSGTLPPYSLRPESDWMPSVMETLALEHRAVSILADTLEKNPHALDRLVLQHQQKDLKTIVELYTGFPQHEIPELLDELGRYIQKVANALQVNFRELEIRIWKLLLSKVIIQDRKWDSRALQKIIVPAFPENLIMLMRSTFKIGAAGYPRLQQVLQPDGQEMKKTKKELDGGAPAPEEVQLGKVLVPDAQSETPQFFKNAGIVLLHPFFNRFFDKLELLEGRSFKDFHCRTKAVLLINYLASGDEKLAEYDMVLPKFLCGMPFNHPMDHLIQITRNEKQEANGLLEAVVANWGALGKSSPDGLREGFLVRDGKLLQKDSGWKLIVEPKAIDVLLDRLPWGIGIVKLPWMPEILKVEWR